MSCNALARHLVCSTITFRVLVLQRILVPVDESAACRR